MKRKFCDNIMCNFPQEPHDIRLGHNRRWCDRCKRVVVTKEVPVAFEDPTATAMPEERTREEGEGK